MVKATTTLMAILSLGFLASFVSAADTTWDNSGTPGSSITIAVSTALIPGAQPLVFQPSAQVNISGASVTTAFGALAGHEAVRGKEAGQNYGMASDSSSVFWLAADATYPVLSGTNSAYFNTNNWNRN